MKTSLSWLGQYVEIPWDARGLAENLTLAGLAVESIDRIGVIPAGVVVAEILSREKHPDADTLSVCQVSTGAGDPVQVVCGAPNCDAGVRVPLAPVGTVLGEGFKIKKAKLRGVASHGMLCSADELGLSDDHTGLLILRGDAPLGAPLCELYEPNVVIDWEVTPNRPDWLSHLGIAREIAAVAANPASFKMPDATLTPVAGPVASELASVTVTAPDLCPRYSARIVRNITIGSSPDWMQTALRAVGVRPINNVVDITNYVLMECGQPLHAFDYDLLADHAIVVRRAKAGETMVTLDDRKHVLSPDHLVIADARKPVALAGIMGGGNSEISDRTTTVLLESAAFDASNIRATAKSLGVSSESSHRFERGVGLEMVAFASARACHLLCLIAGGELVAGCIDAYPAPYEPHEVSCRVARVCSLIGATVAVDQICEFFARLGLTIVERTAARVTVSVPAYRLDLTREVDLIEEVARLFGFDNLPDTRVIAQVGGSMRDDAYVLLEQVRNELLALGLSECVNYSTVSAADCLRCTGFNEDELVTLANPISAEGAAMRASLIPGMMRSLAHNIAHNNHDLAIFELGRVFASTSRLPEERQEAAIVLTGRRHPERFGSDRATAADFFDLKGLLEGWFHARRLTDVVVEVASHPAFRAGHAARLVVGGTEVGVLGELVAELTDGLRLQNPVYMALVEVDRVVALQAPVPCYAALPQFPATERDISLVAPESVSNADIIAALEADRPAWLESVALFDVYTDEQAVGKGKRSLAYTLTYRHPSRTLTDEAVNRAHEAIKAKLAQALAVEYR